MLNFRLVNLSQAYSSDTLIIRKCLFRQVDERDFLTVMCNWILKKKLHASSFVKDAIGIACLLNNQTAQIHIFNLSSIWKESKAYDVGQMLSFQINRAFITSKNFFHKKWLLQWPAIYLNQSLNTTTQTRTTCPLYLCEKIRSRSVKKKTSINKRKTKRNSDQICVRMAVVGRKLHRTNIHNSRLADYIMPPDISV